MNSTPQETSPPEKSKPGIWLWGSMGCLVFIIIGVIAFSLSVKKAVQELTPVPHISAAPGTSAMVNITKIADAVQKMKAITAAVKKYRLDKGSYPDNLEQLVPVYVPAKASLHALVDASSDPTHDSFIYRQPTPTAPPMTLYLGVSYTYTMASGPVSQEITTLIQMSLDGNVQQENTGVANPVSQNIPVPGAASSN